MDPETPASASTLAGSELETRLVEEISKSSRQRWRLADFGRAVPEADLLEILVAVDRLCRDGCTVRLGPGRYRVER